MNAETEQSPDAKPVDAYVITAEQYEQLTAAASAGISANSSLLSLLIKQGLIDPKQAAAHFDEATQNIAASVPPHHRLAITAALELLHRAALKYVAPKDQANTRTTARQ